MGFFKSEQKEEVVPVEHAQMTPTATQRSILIQKDLKEKKNELEGMEKMMKSLQEKIENKRVLIASYEKNIIDHQKDYDRISSKHRILEDDIHTLEKELTLYNKGTHQDLMTKQDLDNLNFFEAAEKIKQFDEKEKDYIEQIQILKDEIKKLKELKTPDSIKSELEPPKANIEVKKGEKSDGFLGKLFTKKKQDKPKEETITSEAENKDSEVVKEVVTKVVDKKPSKTLKKPVKNTSQKKETKKTTKKSSKKLLKDKDKNKLSTKGEKSKK